MKKFKDLLIKHDYYCSDSNYYSNDAAQKYNTFQDFYSNFKDADIDMNLIFRWDIRKDETFDYYFMEIFMIQQRKGIFIPHFIERVKESDFEDIKLLLQPHLDKLAKIWLPFTAFKTIE